jgi:hypothetical protein
MAAASVSVPDEVVVKTPAQHVQEIVQRFTDVHITFDTSTSSTVTKQVRGCSSTAFLTFSEYFHNNSCRGVRGKTRVECAAGSGGYEQENM